MPWGADSSRVTGPNASPAVNQTVLMANFADVENVEPDLADRVRAILSSTTNAVLGTIRRDGSPRLSGADPYFHDGQLRIRSMPRARKGQDLRRDPRVAVHSIPWDSRKLRDGAADVGQADAKVSGTAVLVSDADELSGFRAWLKSERGFEPPRTGIYSRSTSTRSRSSRSTMGSSWSTGGRRPTVARRCAAVKPRRAGTVRCGSPPPRTTRATPFATV